MKILIISPIFYPEEYPIAYLLLETVLGLMRKGHSVQVVTSQGQSLPANCGEFYVDDVHQFEIMNLPVGDSKSNSLIIKGLNYFKFGRVVFKYRNNFKWPDIIYTVVPSNVNGYLAKRLGKYFSCPYIINVQDIHPDAIFATGIVKNRFLKYLLLKQESLMYRHVSGVTVIGKSFKDNLLRKKISAPIKVIPNWVDVKDYISNDEDVRDYKKSLGIGHDKFVVLYSGTFGRIHGAEIILSAAYELRENEKIIFLLVGKGIGFDVIKNQVNKRSLKNVMVLPSIPREKLPVMQALSNISLVTLLPSLGYTSIPSKVLGYMAAARPVLALADADCDTALLINTASCGFVLPPGDVDQFVNVLLSLADNKQSLQEKGLNGRRFIQKYLEKDHLINTLCDFFEETFRVFNK